MMNRKYEHVSFDLDGTLIDSIDVMRIAWEATVDKFHLYHDFFEYHKEVGLPFPVIMESMGIIDEEREIERFYFSKTEEFSDQIKVYDGAIEFIESLKPNGISTSIITSKPRMNTESLLESIDLKVDMLICGDDLIGSKPTALPMQYVKKELNLGEGKKIIYFGDMLSDIVFCVNSKIDYCHCNFGIYGSLPKYLIPVPKSIQNWKDDKLGVFGFTNLEK